MSEYKQSILKLIRSDISGYRICIDTGISQVVMHSLRNGTRKVDNLTLKTSEKLYEYAKAHLNE